MDAVVHAAITLLGNWITDMLSAYPNVGVFAESLVLGVLINVISHFINAETDRRHQ